MNVDDNLNKGFYKDLDTNFEAACELADKNFSHEELIYMLKNGNVPEKQIAALKFDYIKSKNDAETLISNLTGCDGKIREAVALKIYQLLSENSVITEYLSDFSEIFADASIDINGNICRLVADSVIFLKNDENFAKSYTKRIVKFAEDALEELSKFIFRDKKYVINKQLFKLYWCLEGLQNFYTYEDISKIRQILQRASVISEYTIREKVAKIAVLSDEFVEIRNNLKNDDNYYVKEICKTIIL